MKQPFKFGLKKLIESCLIEDGAASLFPISLDREPCHKWGGLSGPHLLAPTNALAGAILFMRRMNLEARKPEKDGRIRNRGKQEKMHNVSSCSPDSNLPISGFLASKFFPAEDGAASLFPISLDREPCHKWGGLSGPHLLAPTNALAGAILFMRRMNLEARKPEKDGRIRNRGKQEKMHNVSSCSPDSNLPISGFLASKFFPAEDGAASLFPISLDREPCHKWGGLSGPHLLAPTNALAGAILFMRRMNLEARKPEKDGRIRNRGKQEKMHNVSSCSPDSNLLISGFLASKFFPAFLCS